MPKGAFSAEEVSALRQAVQMIVNRTGRAGYVAPPEAVAALTLRVARERDLFEAEELAPFVLRELEKLAGAA